jgi:hypothetical protein
MKLNNFLAVKAVISLIFGIAFATAPAALMSMYAVTLSVDGAFMARLLGACLVGIGLICWLNRSADPKVLQGITFSLFFADTIGFIVALLWQSSGSINAFGWVNVIVWLLLALGLGYFRFLKPSSS